MRIVDKYQLAIALLMSVFASARMDGTDDFLKWSKSEARSVALRSFENGGESSGKTFGKVFIGQATSMRAFWVTDPGARAVARITQLEEREREERAGQLHKSLREGSDTTYLLVIWTFSMKALFPSGYPVVGPAEPKRRAKIFLEDKKDESKFVRAVNAEQISFNVEEVFGRRVMGLSEGFMLRFNRSTDDGKPLIKDLKQKIRLRLPSESGVLIATFKLSDFKVERLEAL